MKKAILAVALLAVGATAAAAQYGGGPRPDQRRWSAPPPPPVVVPWTKADHPYAERRHKVCIKKAWELREFDRHAAADGWFSPREKRTHAVLKADLDRTCGGFRWRG